MLTLYSAVRVSTEFRLHAATIYDASKFFGRVENPTLMAQLYRFELTAERPSIFSRICAI